MTTALPSRSRPSPGPSPLDAQVPAQARAQAESRVVIRLDLPGGARIGPGKIALLEEIGRSGSISAAGRVLKMSYRRAWELIEDLNRSLGAPVVSTASGGAGGGGARLTDAGTRLIAAYRTVEAAAGRDAAPLLAELGTIGSP